jgi:hypothetical protein
MFLSSKCLNEPSLCCSTTKTYPRRKKDRTKQKLQRHQRRHYHLNTTSMVRQRHREKTIKGLCNQPLRVLRFILTLRLLFNTELYLISLKELSEIICLHLGHHGDVVMYNQYQDRVFRNKMILKCIVFRNMTPCNLESSLPM